MFIAHTPYYFTKNFPDSATCRHITCKSNANRPMHRNLLSARRAKQDGRIGCNGRGNSIKVQTQAACQDRRPRDTRCENQLATFGTEAEVAPLGFGETISEWFGIDVYYASAKFQDFIADNLLRLADKRGNKHAMVGCHMVPIGTFPLQLQVAPGAMDDDRLNQRILQQEKNAIALKLHVGGSDVPHPPEKFGMTAHDSEPVGIFPHVVYHDRQTSVLSEYLVVVSSLKITFQAALKTRNILTHVLIQSPQHPQHDMYMVRHHPMLQHLQPAIYHGKPPDFAIHITAHPGIPHFSAPRHSRRYTTIPHNISEVRKRRVFPYSYQIYSGRAIVMLPASTDLVHIIAVVEECLFVSEERK